jgi:5S rRNA maturation endonuclease (ribonuclease M5)
VSLVQYEALPTIDEFKSMGGQLYIPGYTETFELVPDVVRIVPNLGFTEGWPVDIRKSFPLVGFPCYRISIKQGKDHYGFILRGTQSKKTPRYSSWVSVFNLEAVYSKSTYLFVVEGMKDAFLFLYYKLPVIAMLTSNLQDAMYEEIAKQGKTVIFIPDGDETGRKQSVEMIKKSVQLGINSCVIKLNSAFMKDMGEFMDYPEKREYIGRLFKYLMSISKQVKNGSKEYVHKIVTM